MSTDPINPLPPLPEGYESKTAKNGRIYYINHKTRTTSWKHPDPTVRQPWEHLTDVKGRTYYVNHAERTTNWMYPAKRLELRRLGLVPPSAMMPTGRWNELSLPQGHERRMAADGNVYYFDTTAQKASWVHPAAVAKLEDSGETELADVEAVGLEDGPGQGNWMVECTAEAPCEGERYWVDYRSGGITDWDPKDRKTGRETAAKMAPQDGDAPTNLRIEIRYDMKPPVAQRSFYL